MKLKTKNYKFLSLKRGIAFDVIILYHWILFKIGKSYLKKKKRSKITVFHINVSFPLKSNIYKIRTDKDITITFF